MSFYDDLQTATAADRGAFLSIPLIQSTVQKGASRALYVDFLTQAYHHVKHTYPLLALASVHTDGRGLPGCAHRVHEGGARPREVDPRRHTRAWAATPRLCARASPGRPARSWSATPTMRSSGSAPTRCSAACTCSKGCRRCWPTRPPTPSSARSRFRGRMASPTCARTGRSTSSTSPSSRGSSTASLRTPTRVIVETSQIIYRLYGDIFRELAIRHPGRRDAA